MRRFLWLLLAVLLAVLVALTLETDDGNLAGLNRQDFASVLVKSVLLLFVGTLAFTFFRDRISKAVETATLWLVVGLALAIGYAYRFELQAVGDRVLSELMPGRAATRGRTVEIARGGGGNFGVTAQVNGARVALVLDTGASSVVLTQEAARAAGLPLEVLQYSVNIDTANGRARAAPVTLDQLAVGGIVERAVPALIAQPGQLRTSLLGMSFLNRLESWEVRGDRLVLRGQ